MSGSWKKPGLGGGLLYAVVGALVSSIAANFARLEVRRSQERTDAVRGLPTGGLIVIANHTSLADGVFLALAGRQLGRPLRLLGTAGIIEAPVLRLLFRKLGFIAVHRKGPNPAAALAPAADALRQGEAIALYPEGRITRNDRFWPERAKTGAVRLAVDVGVPIVALASVGANNVVGRRHKLRGLLRSLWRRPEVQMRLGTPFSPREFLQLPPTGPVAEPSPEQIRSASDEMMRHLVSLVAELRREPAPDPLGVASADASQSSAPDPGLMGHLHEKDRSSTTTWGRPVRPLDPQRGTKNPVQRLASRLRSALRRRRR
jgi:1-acyl-sn-glycerol-3-phosphate acyltransferase